jgi:hypothetical protein
MKLPPLANPRDYVGLFVFDFGDRANVGYVAEEIAFLMRHPRYRSGQAYVICGDDPAGRLALRGATELSLLVEEGMIFAHGSAASADASYEALRSASHSEPAPIAVRLERADSRSHSPSHLVVLTYRAHASALVGGWLQRLRFDGGDEVWAGADELARFLESGASLLQYCDLPTESRYTARTERATLESVHLPVQR